VLIASFNHALGTLIGNLEAMAILAAIILAARWSWKKLGRNKLPP